MAKIEITPGSLIKNQPGGEHITRISYGESEPPKNYIWCPSEDEYYIWNGKEWVLYEYNDYEFPKPNININEIVYKSDLNSRIKLLKSELLRQLKKMVELRSCNKERNDNIYYEEVENPALVQL